MGYLTGRKHVQAPAAEQLNTLCLTKSEPDLQQPSSGTMLGMQLTHKRSPLFQTKAMSSPRDQARPLFPELRFPTMGTVSRSELEEIAYSQC